MNVPLVFFFCYLFMGMIATMALWGQLSDEIDLSIEMEESEVEAQGALRMFITVVFVLAWPVVVSDVIRRS